MSVRHFLSLLDFSSSELNQLLQLAIETKATNPQPQQCHGKIMALLFEKPSTRTRLSFEVGIKQLGGNAVFLSYQGSQLSRGETIEDSARSISSMVDLILARLSEHSTLQQFAKHSRVPVINGLTDRFHPCQLLADMQAYLERRGPISGSTVAWVGDGNNMCHSYINAARQFDFQLNIACPQEVELDIASVSANKERIHRCQDPKEAVRNANLVVTDTWASMDRDEGKDERLHLFQGFQVNHELLSYAANKAVFTHCLPAHRGQEVSGALLEDTDISLAWDAVENRLHAQKALIQCLLS